MSAKTFQDALLREVVMSLRAYELVKFLHTDGWSWCEVFDRDPDEGSMLAVLNVACEDFSDSEIKVIFKQYLGEALAKALGAEEVVIKW